MVAPHKINLENGGFICTHEERTVVVLCVLNFDVDCFDRTYSRVPARLEISYAIRANGMESFGLSVFKSS